MRIVGDITNDEFKAPTSNNPQPRDEKGNGR